MSKKIPSILGIIAILLSLYSVFQIHKTKKQLRLVRDQSNLQSLHIASLTKYFTTSSDEKNTLNSIVSNLKHYDAFDADGQIKLVRLGKDNDGGYQVSLKALEASDVLLGYGIANDNSFEEQYSVQYNKPSYGFDCGVEHISSKSKLFTFVKECISTDKSLYFSQNSSGQISSFSQQLKRLRLNGKKIFIKMDIEGAEYEALQDVLKFSKDITGIALEIHFDDYESTKKALHLLQELSKNFVLLNIHGNNCSSSYFISENAHGMISKVLELSYINKNLVTQYHLASNQKYPSKEDMPNCKRKDVEFEIIK